jgi:hypothetical protein
MIKSRIMHLERMVEGNTQGSSRKTRRKETVMEIGGDNIKMYIRSKMGDVEWIVLT